MTCPAVDVRSVLRRLLGEGEEEGVPVSDPRRFLAGEGVPAVHVHRSGQRSEKCIKYTHGNCYKTTSGRT